MENNEISRGILYTCILAAMYITACYGSGSGAWPFAGRESCLQRAANKHDKAVDNCFDEYYSRSEFDACMKRADREYESDVDCCD